MRNLLDRIWLWMIGLSFAFMVIIWIGRWGAPFVLGLIALACWDRFIRHPPDPEESASSCQPADASAQAAASRAAE